MEQYEDFHVESSDEEVQVVAPVPVAVVGPLNVEVAEIPDNPESPSPQPSPVSPQPSPASTVGASLNIRLLLVDPPCLRLRRLQGRIPPRS